jgi:hypothetical protein
VRRGCTVLLFALADLSHPALARTYLNLHEQRSGHRERVERRVVIDHEKQI